MFTNNLHTLDSDVLFELLTSCPDLTTLHSLISTHSTLYHAFNNHRRLILKRVFLTQHLLTHPRIDHARTITNAATYISKLKNIGPADSATLRETLWPDIETHAGSRQVSKWGAGLLSCYQRAELTTEALALVKKATRLLMRQTAKEFRHIETKKFFESAFITYMKAGQLQEAIALQESALQYINPRSPVHAVWSKELVAKYIANNEPARARKLQQDTWDLYAAISPNSIMALDWARLLVREVQSAGHHEEALAFHQKVRRSLDPTKNHYIAWSRQHILMAQKLGKEDEALATIEEVWRRLRPDSTGYYAWTAQLSKAFEDMGRIADAIGVFESAWEANGAVLARNPKDELWRYRTRLTGLQLARVYRRYEREGDAGAIEKSCEDLDDQTVEAALVGNKESKNCVTFASR
ncbi:hypothetical protein CC80DRAFT_492328 [Byssothecium circinans]|uniref:TPR-like protein n=1 Tax=Byssothecium circinans TaxID=147558 RepID=A0A6A5U1E9_9PLEO|nr:hypothetical protein CC80DRAFT_492328 [Byssothecium circinans]